MSWIGEHAFELGILGVLLLVLALLLIITVIVALPYIKQHLNGNRKRIEAKRIAEEQFEIELQHDKVIAAAVKPRDAAADAVRKRLQARRAREQKSKIETQSVWPPLKTKEGDAKRTPLVAPGDGGAIALDGDSMTAQIFAGTVSVPYVHDNKAFRMTTASVVAEDVTKKKKKRKRKPKTLDEALEGHNG